MGIESLHKAALAAGFAMATPDDDPPVETRHPAPDPDEFVQPAGQWRPLFGSMHMRGGTRDAILGAVGWIRDHLPAVGGRAPA